MSFQIPPILSSTPPPLDDDNQNDDFDQFTCFTGCGISDTSVAIDDPPDLELAPQNHEERSVINTDDFANFEQSQENVESDADIQCDFTDAKQESETDLNSISDTDPTNICDRSAVLNNVETEISQNENDDDGFADFATFDNNQGFEVLDTTEFGGWGSNVENQLPDNEGGESFADFNDPSFDDFQTFENNDEFSDFSSGQPDIAGHSEKHEPQIRSLQLSTENELKSEIDSFPDQSNIKDVISSVFLPNNDNTPNVDSLQRVSELFASANISERFQALWSNLEDLEKTPAIGFQWDGSRAFQELLRSLNIDSRNILSGSFVPIFAMNLGLLEPTKGPAPVNKDGIEDGRYTSGNSPGKEEISSIPPAQFDWSSSGLVNPLEFGQGGSMLLDLEFFGASDDIPSEEPPRIAGYNEKQSPISNTNLPNQSVIEKLLSSSKSTAVQNPESKSRPAELQDEAAEILDKIPDLSFMQAKVLMFPVHTFGVS